MRKFEKLNRMIQKGKVTRKEKSKLGIYVLMAIFGTMFISSLKELWLNDILANYSSSTILIFAGIGIYILYYLLEIK